MAILWYFIKEILFQSDNAKIQQDPSATVYCLPYFVLQFLLISSVYFLPPLSQDASCYFIILSFIIWVILGAIVIDLCIDLFDRIRTCIIGDLCRSFAYDFKNKSAVYGEDYMFYQQRFARHRDLFNDNSMCSICGNEYVDDNMALDKSILCCGHVFHKQCLQRFERYQWDNNNWQYPKSKCQRPSCHNDYHAHCQKFDYNENYWNTLPCYHRPCYSFLNNTTHSLYWNVIYKQYKEYKDLDISQRPGFLPRNIQLMIDIIANICNLGIELLHKFTEFVGNSALYFISIMSDYLSEVFI